MASLLKSNPANQPDKIFLASDDAIDALSSGGDAPLGELKPSNTSYNSFKIDLKQSIFACKGIQLASFVQANTPGDGACISDYECAIGFLYYKQSSLSTAPSSGDLKQLYLLASTNVTDTGSVGTEGSWINRYFSSYADLVVALNSASVNLGAGPAGGADITFAYDTTHRRIYFYGNDNTAAYMPAGYSDPLVVDFINNNTPGLNPVPQSKTLNQRLGFTTQAYNYNTQSYGGTGAAVYIYPNGYPNLIRTGSITLRTSFHNQSSINSKDNRDVLAVVPTSVPFLGVNIYSPKISHWLSNIPETVQQLTISFYDDANQPYWVDDNVSTTIELLCSY